MNEPPELEKKIPLPDEVKRAGQDGNLVLFIGAGISRLLGLPSWEAFANKVLEYLHKKGHIELSEIEQLKKSLDPRQRLSIAKSISKTEKVELELEKYFKEVPKTEGIYKMINAIGCVYVTTNYDGLLKDPLETGETQVTKRVYDREKIYSNLLDKPRTVIHLHGYKDDPKTMIVTTEDYLEHYNHSNIQEFLIHLFQKKIVVFLGYGLGEMEILEHIFRQGKTGKTNELKRFNVQGFPLDEKPLYKRLYKYYEETFGVELLGFAMDNRDDYKAIEYAIKDWEGQIEIQEPLLYQINAHIQESLASRQHQRVQQEDILMRVENKPELKSAFFREIKGLEWFSRLQEVGYFNSEKIPPPKSLEREGKIIIPIWESMNYLVKTAPELDTEKNKLYHKEFLSIIENATGYAKNKGFSNYQVWWRFAKILCHIPHNFIRDATIDAVDYWLEDKYDSDLVADIIGRKFLPKLFNSQDEHATYIANGLLSKLFHVSFKPYPLAISETGQKAYFRFDDYWAKKIIEAIASKVGKRLGREGISVFHNELTYLLKELKKDEWSSDWQPAIADHEQNSFHDDVENMLVLGYRDSLTGFIQSSPDDAKEYLRELLNNEYATIQRIAIYCIGKKREPYNELWDRIIDKKFFHYNFQHEIWQFLKLNYRLFTEPQKEKTLKIIRETVRKDENEIILKKPSAYLRSRWLKAIKDYGKKEAKMYQNEIKITKEEPVHPDFSSYMRVGRGSIMPTNSPHTKAELEEMEISDLVKALKSSKDNGLWGTPEVGLSQTFKDAIASNPLRYIDHLDKFKGLDLPYVDSIVVGYSECWHKKAELPWDDIWLHLLNYISDVIMQKDFWNTTDITNRNYLVMTIGSLIKEGVQSDDHAFDEKYHQKAKKILEFLLQNQKSVTFNKNRDVNAVNITINSARGKCTKALIYLALRHCRLADKKIEEHTEAWQEFEHCFDAELKRKENINYEFFVLVSEYIPYFHYMSKEWIMKNLDVIFDQRSKKKWRCTMQGYSYMDRFILEVYQHLKSQGHIMQALNDDGLPEECSSRFIKEALRWFLLKKESLDDKNSLIHTLLSRGKSHEIRKIIHFCCFPPEERKKFAPQVYELWTRVQKTIKDSVGFSSEEGRKLIASLCCWVEFLDKIDDERRKLLLEITPYAYSKRGFPSRLLKELARISERQQNEQQQFVINEIWQAAINGMPEDNYGFLNSEEEIKTILQNLVSIGEEGERAARKTVSKCIEKGISQPSEILSEILNE